MLGRLPFATKVANGVGAALGGILYDFTGLTQGVAPADAPANAGTVLGLATGLLIAVMVGTGTWTFRRYDLDRARHAAIRAALDDRDSALPPTTPA